MKETGREGRREAIERERREPREAWNREGQRDREGQGERGRESKEKGGTGRSQREMEVVPDTEVSLLFLS